MPYDKGDFTQQGINGDVSAVVRLNEKRVMKVVLSSDDESDNCDISGAVYDLLNGTSYSVGSAPSGTIEITANGTGIDVAQYRYADVSVSGGVGFPKTTFTIHNADENILTLNTVGQVMNYAVNAEDIGENSSYIIYDFINNRWTSSISIPANGSKSFDLYYASPDAENFAFGVGIAGIDITKWSSITTNNMSAVENEGVVIAYRVTDTTVSSSIEFTFEIER